MDHRLPLQQGHVHREDNSWSFIPTRVGEYDGKCAELCGEYHSMMLFNVKAVEQDEYDE
ncbi:hypothetical protein [Microbacterium sp. CH12i]|uniref:hypothetical protein n=1 Tax=Microbacterium sp. CH12i TaxID=1479651 RepID=UPI003FA5B28F